MECMINNINTYYEICGEGIPIIILHGWGVDHRILKGWIEPTFHSLKKRYKRVYIDLPGMGKTPVNDSIRSSDDMCDFVYKFINHVIPNERYLLVGKSYGGYLSRGLAKMDSKRISGMFLICPLVFCETQREHAPKRSVVEVEKGIKAIIPKEEWESFDLFHARQTVSVWNLYKEHILPATKIADYHFLDTVLINNKSFKDPIDSPDNHYTFPSVFLSGRQDWCVGYTDLFSILEQYKRASYLVIDNAGHNLEYEQFEIVKTHFLKWLEEVELYCS
jgi:pimeloyl-ACP methyl ester carboxylesterase